MRSVVSALIVSVISHLRSQEFLSLACLVLLYTLILNACTPLEVNPRLDEKAHGEKAPTTSSSATQNENPVTQRPTWKVGDQWEYEWKSRSTGRSGTAISRVVKEERFEESPCFVIERDGSEYLFTKDVLGYLVRRRGGEILVKRNVPYQFFSWPLKQGRQWRNRFRRETPQGGSQNRDYQMVVETIETVTVPAGTFRAFKTQVYHMDNGELHAEYWYSPEVKWIVKSKIHGKRGWEDRLKSFNVN
jgi:hypothetical protein